MKKITLLIIILTSINLYSQDYIYQGLKNVEAKINEKDDQKQNCLDVPNYNGNVSLQNENIKSITARNTYNLDSPSSINDGFLSLLEDGYESYNNQKIKRGTWLSTNKTNWIEIEFYAPVSITSYNIYPRSDNYYSRMVKDYYFSYSKNNGLEYHQLPKKTIKDRFLTPYNSNFSEPLDCVTNVRLNTISNFGDYSYIQITELELLQ